MATPNATSSTLLNPENVEFEDIQSADVKSEDIQSDEVKSEDIQSDEVKSEDIQSDEVKSEDIQSDEVKSEKIQLDDVKSEDLKAEDVKSEEDVSQDLHMTALPTMISLPIAVTSPHWRSTLETLLRFPGMAPNVKLFRPGNTIAEIAFALGVTDPAYTIIENNWVTIAERIIEIQTCCLMQAKHIDFDIAADGWITWDITAEWYARVLRDLQGKGFSTMGATVVPFVVRVYMRTKSWVRFHHPKGRQRHKQVIDALRPDPSAQMVVKSCSTIAQGFTSVVRAIRKRKLEQIKVI